MSAVTGSQQDAGSTVVEMVVAAALTVLALSMVAGDTIPALRVLEREDAQLRQLELVAAGELAARSVRGARPEGARPPIGLDDQRLVLAMPNEATVVLTLADGALRIDVEGAPPGMDGITSGTVVSGLDPNRSAFALIDAAGEPSADGATAAAVLIVLTDDTSRVVRVVRPRMTMPLDGATPW